MDLSLIQELREAKERYTGHISELFGRAAMEIENLQQIVDSPDPKNFLEATEKEAKHQNMRWGTTDDAGKTDADWFWLIGYLAGKVLHTTPEDLEKRLHRITTIAAAASNWHHAIRGKNNMRPGIAPPKQINTENLS